MRNKELRVISSAGEQLGVIPAKEALSMAKEEGLDLVLVAASAKPPVAKIVDYGKWKYEQNKQKKDQKRKPQEVKGIKISPNIAEHDIQVAVRKAKEFLADGDKVRIVCRFRYRELAYPKRGEEKLNLMAEYLAEEGKAERAPVLNGREMVLVLNPKPQGSGGKKDAKEQDKNEDKDKKDSS